MREGLYKSMLGWLFETGAVKVSPKGKPFWYTSGTVGPYYINTHFLFGGEQKADELLALINKGKYDMLSLPGKILGEAMHNYAREPVYRALVDEMCNFIRNNIDISSVGCISGGERRDWFFSVIAAEMLGKPHISIFKKLNAVVTVDGKTSEITDLGGQNVLHIADLITEASSYERAWIPSIRSRNGRMKWSAVIVDRKQGGGEYLRGEGIEPYAMMSIDRGFFDAALSLNLIDKGQYEMILNFMNDPKGSMRSFLLENPAYLAESLQSGGKTSERARLCIENNVYQIEEAFLSRFKMYLDA